MLKNTILVSLIILLYSCKSDDLVDYSDLLTGGDSKTWKLTEVRINDDKDAYTESDTCFIGRKYGFHLSNIFVSYGNENCSGELDSAYGAWSFNEFQTAIILDGAHDGSVYKETFIFEFKDNQLIIEKAKNGKVYYLHYDECSSCPKFSFPGLIEN